MKGICPKCEEVGTRRISVRTLKNGKERRYLDFIHTDKPGKRGGRVLSHYIGTCIQDSGLEDLIRI